MVLPERVNAEHAEKASIFGSEKARRHHFPTTFFVGGKESPNGEKGLSCTTIRISLTVPEKAASVRPKLRVARLTEALFLNRTIL